ncbi:hypothetical protein QQ045_008101 [Rhodiola kirilowii]
MTVQKPAVEPESSDSDETDDSQLNSGTVKPVDAAAKPREEEKVLVTNGKKRKKRESDLTESEEKIPVEELKKHRVFGGKSEEEQIVSDSDLVRLIVDSALGVSEDVVRIGLNLIGKVERVKMAEQWEKLLIDENKFKLKRLELQMETNKLVLDALRSSSH